MEPNEEHIYNKDKIDLCPTTTEMIVSVCTTHNPQHRCQFWKNSTGCLWHVPIIYCYFHCCKVHLCYTCQLTFSLVYVNILDFILFTSSKYFSISGFYFVTFDFWTKTLFYQPLRYKIQVFLIHFRTLRSKTLRLKGSELKNLKILKIKTVQTKTPKTKTPKTKILKTKTLKTKVLKAKDLKLKT